jgi:hypothetical protein
MWGQSHDFPGVPMIRKRAPSYPTSQRRNATQRARVPAFRRSPSPTTTSTARPAECIEVAVKVRPPPRAMR